MLLNWKISECSSQQLGPNFSKDRSRQWLYCCPERVPTCLLEYQSTGTPFYLETYSLCWHPSWQRIDVTFSFFLIRSGSFHGNQQVSMSWAESPTDSVCSVVWSHSFSDANSEMLRKQHNSCVALAVRPFYLTTEPLESCITHILHARASDMQSSWAKNCLKHP